MPEATNIESERREFLKKGIFILGGLTLLGLGIPGATYFLSPLWQRKEEDWIELGPVSAIPTGTPTKVDFVQRKKDGWATIEGRASAWVVTADGAGFIAYDPRCTHLGCPYRWDEGKAAFVCPCHTAIFDVEGKVVAGPAPRGLDRFATKVVEGRLFIRPTPPKEG
ncbi:MAG: Rieske (2Fe-2S) protein [Deltaproteobacteria bacterium]|nr:Rieske (2Fe-2S) protein [Deltaproteobacteria bacterium]